MPTPPPTAPDLPLDKVFHGLFYLPLGALMFAASGGWTKPGYRMAAASALAAGGYGLALEAVQYFLPWRSFEWADAAMDLLGGIVGAAGAWHFRRRTVRAKNVPSALKPDSEP